MKHLHAFHNHDIDSIADAMIRAICGAEAEEMIRHKLTLAVSPDGERRLNSISHAVYFDVLFKRLAPYEKRWKSMLHALWADEQAIILANLKKLKKSQLCKSQTDHVMYPASQFKNRLSKETKKIMTVILADLGQDKLDELGAGKGVKDLGIAFDVGSPQLKKWLATYVFKFSEELETVNSEKLRRILDAGFEQGKTIPEMMLDVKECFDSWDTYRAEIITRTEVSRASNEAAVEAYRQSGVVQEKQWLTAPGCCDICAEMDGEVVALGDAFFDDGYGDGMSPPKHPNCRCSVVAFFSD
jgi:SPP1 gp7 family putative phage head morphogenesis protein